MNRPRVVWLLRIGWSAGCVIACLWLVALWVRSYWRFDNLWWKFPIELSVASTRGTLYVNESFVFDTGAFAVEPLGWDALGFRTGFYSVIDTDKTELRQMKWGFSVPHLVALFASAAFAALPWLRWRFSLRTLLVATTLVAVVLGVVVWWR